MHIHYISEQNSILNHFLAQLRDVKVQNDSMRFRKNMERIGEIMAYELSKKLSYKETSIITPLGTKDTMLIKDEVVLCSILRAGLALHTGFMSFFDDAETDLYLQREHTELKRFWLNIRQRLRLKINVCFCWTQCWQRDIQWSLFSIS